MNVSPSNFAPRFDTATPHEATYLARRQCMLAQVERFDELADAACTALDASPEAAPALGLLLRLAEAGVPAQDLAALDDALLEQVAQLQDEHPDLVRFWLAGLPARLADRQPWQSVQDAFRASLSSQALRDLKRSVDRSAAESIQTADYGVSWRTYFSTWRTQIVELMSSAMLLGSGHVTNRRECNFNTLHEPDFAELAEQAAHRTSVPLPDFTRAGKTGYCVAFLYGLAMAGRTGPWDDFALLSHHSTSPYPQLPPPDSESGAESASMLVPLSKIVANGWNAFMETTGHASTLARQWLDAPLPFDPLRMPAAQAQWPSSVHARGAIETPTAPRLPQIRAFNATSPALQRLFDIAHLWRHRAALHHEQQISSAPSLSFHAPPTEQTLLFDLLDRAPELSGLDVDALLLRRLTPSQPDSRVHRVHYWPLPEAAQLIRSGRLDILNTDSGTFFAVSETTPAGAIAMVPSVMSASRFAELVGVWRAQCDAREHETWQPPISLGALLNSTDTASVQRDMAISDLTIAYEAGWLSHRALRLGRTGLLPWSTVAPGPVSVYTHPLQFSSTGDGETTRVMPAGTFVLCERPQAGTTLLYLMGEPVAWREYASPQAMFDAIGQNAHGLRDTLHTRLPRMAQSATAPQALSPALAPLTTAAPMSVAANATLGVIAAEVPLRSAEAQTRSRISEYRNWIDGAGTGDLERGLMTAVTNPATGTRVPANHGLTWTASDIDNIAQYQTLRGDLSFALPEPREIARQYVKSVLTKNGITQVDPDDLFVTVGRMLARMSLPDVLIRKATNPASLTVGQILRRRGDGALVSWPATKMPGDGELTATKLVDQLSATEYLSEVSDAFDTLWRTHFDEMRQSLKGEFIAQCWLGKHSPEFSADVMEIARRVGGPIELSRLRREILRQRVPSPQVVREWLRIQGHETSLMAITIQGKPAVLLLAGYADGLRVHGFDSRDALTAWFDEQISTTTGRQRLAGTVSGVDAMPTHDLWLKDANINSQGAVVPAGTGTFTALTQSYREKYLREFQPGTKVKTHERLINVMHHLSQLDLLIGMGTWISPELRPLSATIAMADVGFGVVGLSVGIVTGDGAARRQGWQSLASAVGSQGLASARFKAQAVLTQDPKYTFFTGEVPIAREALIPGLHRTGQRLYAAIDSSTRSYLSFDEATGFFRAARPPSSVHAPESGPLMRLSPSGRWHTVSLEDLPVPPLEDPHIGWRIDQRFLARYDALRAQRNPAFEAARRASVGVDATTAGGTAVTPSSLRMLKLEFLDRSVQDPAELGALARRIEAAQNAIDAADTVASSPLRQMAEAAGAQYRQVIQRPHTYLGHVRRGLARVTALSARTGMIEAVPIWFNEIGRQSPAAAASFMEDLSRAGTIADSLIAGPPNTIPLADLDSIFDASQGTYRVFEMRAGTRTMAIGHRPLGHEATTYFFFDPNEAFVSATEQDQLVSMVRAHLEAMSDVYQMAREGEATVVTMAEIDVQRLSDAPLLQEFEVMIPVHEAFGLPARA